MPIGATGLTGLTGEAGDDASPVGSGGYPVRGPHSMMFLFDANPSSGGNQGTGGTGGSRTHSMSPIPNDSETDLFYWKPHAKNDLSGQFQTHNAYDETSHFHCQYTGIYLVNFQFQFPANATGSRAVFINEVQGGVSNRRFFNHCRAAADVPTKLSVSGVLSLSGPRTLQGTLSPPTDGAGGTGVPGDYYWNTSTFAMYGPKSAAHAWGASIGNFPSGPWDTSNTSGQAQSFVTASVWQDSGADMSLARVVVEGQPTILGGYVEDVAPRLSCTFLRVPGHDAYEGDAAFDAWGDTFGYFTPVV